MLDSLDAVGLGLAERAAPRSPVRCGFCNGPVVRSPSQPSVLRHQRIAGHGNGAGNAVDVFFTDGPCPQEGAPVPGDLLSRIPVSPG